MYFCMFSQKLPPITGLSSPPPPPPLSGVAPPGSFPSQPPSAGINPFSRKAGELP